MAADRRMIERILVETEMPGDSRTIFRVRMDDLMIEQNLTAAQAHLIVEEVLDRITLPRPEKTPAHASPIGVRPYGKIASKPATGPRLLTLTPRQDRTQQLTSGPGHHLPRAGIPLRRAQRKFLRLLESYVRGQRRDFGIGLDFQDDRTLCRQGFVPRRSEFFGIIDIIPLSPIISAKR